jgi:hypothetical protein
MIIANTVNAAADFSAGKPARFANHAPMLTQPNAAHAHMTK